MAIPERPKLDPIELPQEPGLFGGWGQKFEVTLVRFVFSIFNAVMEPLYNARDAALDYFAEKTGNKVRPLLVPFLDQLEAIPGLPPEIQYTITQLRGTEPFSLTAIAIGLAIASLGALVGGLRQPFVRLGMYQAESKAHSARMSPSEAFASWKRGGLSVETYKNQFLHGGWSDELLKGWETILAPLVSVGDLSALFLRGEVSEAAFNSQLANRGYTVHEIAKIKELLKVIPPIPDIIRMAVREAFTPDIVEQFELHAELPDEMVEWATKQGLSEDWAKAYWASHWELPSLRMGYEMLHRGVIDESVLQLLIKAHDVSPFWRDKLVDISYNPYTRVDVRRMYNVGVLTEEQVYRNYLDLGSNPEKARNLTAFTVALANATERDLTKSEILYGYEHGLLNDAETDSLLLGLGYDAREIEYYKTRVNYKRYQVIVKDTVKYVSQLFIANQLDEAGVYAQLGDLNLPAEQVNRYLRQWELKRKAKTKTLTSESLLKFRKMDIIDNTEFGSEMGGLGYSDKYIGWFLKSIKKA